MLFKKICIEQYGSMGRGIKTLEDIPAFTVVMMEPTLSIPPREQIGTIKRYTFKLGSTQMEGIVLGYGALLNHSDLPNIGYSYGQNGLMMFRTIRDVKAQEQLTIDYRYDDPNVDLKQYGIKL